MGRRDWREYMVNGGDCTIAVSERRGTVSVSLFRLGTLVAHAEEEIGDSVKEALEVAGDRAVRIAEGEEGA